MNTPLPPIDQLLQTLGLNNLSEADKGEVSARLGEHFNQLIIDTVICSLPDDRVEEFERILNLPPEEQGDKIANICSAIPGLWDRLQSAVDLEVESLKIAYSKAQ